MQTSFQLYRLLPLVAFFALLQTVMPLCDLWSEPGFVCNLTTHFSCFKDCCELGLAFCYPEKERCRYCHEHQELCGTEEMDVACFHYCQQLQQPKTLFSVQEDDYIRVPKAAIIGGLATLGTLTVVLILVIVWNLRMKAKEHRRKQSEEATPLVTAVDYKAVDENLNYPTKNDQSLITTINPSPSRHDLTASDASVNLGELRLKNADDQSSTSSRHSGDSPARRRSVPDQAVSSNPSAPDANDHPTPNNPGPVHRGYTAVTHDSAYDIHNTPPLFSALHPTSSDTDNEPVSVPLSTNPIHHGYKSAP